MRFYPQRYRLEMDMGKRKPPYTKTFDHGHHPPFKLTEDDAREVYRLYDRGKGMRQKDIAPIMGVTRGVIYNILSGKQYPHVYKELDGSPPIRVGMTGQHKLGEKEAHEIWRLHLNGMIQAELAPLMDVSGVTLSNILTGKRFHDLYLKYKPMPRKNRCLNGALKKAS